MAMITKSIFDLLHITEGALNSCSRHRKRHGKQNLNVGEGHTLCLTSQEQYFKFFNDKLFSSKMTNLKAFHSCLVSVLSTSAGVEKDVSLILNLSYLPIEF